MLNNINKIPIIRVLAMPKHLGPSGTIFGGWVISQMDLAGGIFAWSNTKGKITTVNCNNINFYKPIFVADVINCHANIIEKNISSVKIKIETKIERPTTDKIITAVDGIFTYVAIDHNGNPREI